MKILRWEPSCVMRTEKHGKKNGQRDVTKLTVEFRNSANAPNNCRLFVCLPICLSVCLSDCLSV